MHRKHFLALVVAPARGGVTALSPKQGTVVQSSPDAWSHDV
jgi:hypothetical protein